MTCRSPKTLKRYRKRQAVCGGFDKNTCPFCKIDNTVTDILHDGKYFYVIYNAFPYDIWDGQGVTDHLMITPKRHVCSVSEFTGDEAREFQTLLAEYEFQNYSVYFRHKDNIMKSVEHQHTHLMKFNDKKLKINLYISRPYTLWWK